MFKKNAKSQQKFRLGQTMTNYESDKGRMQTRMWEFKIAISKCVPIVNAL